MTLELPITRQLLETAAALLLGAAAGLFYDALRTLRRHLRLRLITALCDLLFCLAVVSSLFLLGITVGGGRQRLMLCVLAALGGALYFLTISRTALFLLHALADLIVLFFRLLTSPVVIFGLFLKKITISSKKLFYYWLKWYIFKEKRTVAVCRLPKERANEKNEYIYEAGVYHSHRVPGRADRQRVSAARPRRARPRRAEDRD